MFFVEVVYVEIFVKESLVLEVGWEELVLFLQEVHRLVVKRLIILAVFIQFGYEVEEYPVRVVKLVVLYYLSLAFVGQAVSS